MELNQGNKLFDPKIGNEIKNVDTMKNITPKLLLNKWKGGDNFMDVVYKFAIPASWTDNQRGDLVKAYPTNIFLADLADNIAWVIVKMIDNQEHWVV